MMKLITRFSSALYHNPKIIRLNLLAKKVKEQPQQIKETARLRLTDQFRQSDRQVRQSQVSIKALQQSMERQNDSHSKSEQGINHLIKIETKVSSLYKLHKSRQFQFTTKNLVNLLIKVLQLRNINTKQSQQTQKFDHLLGLICKKLNKFSPEDMIRFIHALKKVKILHSDFLKLRSLIQLILEEFSSRTDETTMKKSNQFESFYVITLDANIKLLHSLFHLHSITGSQYEPLIANLIKGSLFYFHRLITGTSKDKSMHNPKQINWSFFISFIRISSHYSMPLDVTLSFISALNKQKRSYQGTYNYLFAIEEIIHNVPSIQSQLRGTDIAKYPEIYHIHHFIYELIEKPNQLIKMRPLHLLSHVKCLASFTDDEVNALKFQNMRGTTLERILLFTNKVFEKYFLGAYSNEVEQVNIEKWVLDGHQSSKQYLGPFLLIYRDLINRNIVKNVEQSSKLLNLCRKHFDLLTSLTQTVILKISLEESIQNCKPLLDTYFGRGQKENSSTKVRKFKKAQEINAYVQLFPYWERISLITTIPIDLYSENCFFKVFFSRIMSFPIDQYASHLADRIIVQNSYLSLLVKKYVKISQSNRFLGKSSFEKIQNFQFKRQLQQLSTILENERQDTNKLNEYAQLKMSIRLNMRRGLSIFKFLILMLENINKKMGNSEVNITKSTLYKQLQFHFNEQIKCLHFKPLFTHQIYDLVNQIFHYLQSKDALDQNSEIFKISQYEQSQKKRKQLIHKQEGLYAFSSSPRT